MPLGRSIVKGLVYKIDLSKIADRANPRTVEAPIRDSIQEPVVIDWGDGSSEVVASGTFPEHTYDTVGIYTVVMRSATGHLPRIKFTTSQSWGATSEKNVTLAVTAIDHFGGWSGQINGSSGDYICLNAGNLQFADPRYVCGPFWTSMGIAFGGTGLTQDTSAFTFEFQNASNYGAVFRNCTNLKGSTPNLPESARSISYAFMSCTSLTQLGELPSGITSFAYAFNNCYNMEGTFPELPSATGALTNTFYGCVKLTGKLPDIPEGVTSLQAAFCRCLGATAFPENLPDTLTNVYQAFYNCQGLNNSENAAPELWDTESYPSISSHDQCFYKLTNLSNYADIPADWK